MTRPHFDTDPEALAFGQWFLTKTLKLRGWTDAMISRIAGAPDHVEIYQSRAACRGVQQRHAHCYCPARIRALEQADAFRLAQQRSLARKAARAAIVLPPVTPDSIAAAVRTVNRAAKRRRDAASTSYAFDMHGLARHNKRAKHDLYQLKDKGFRYLRRAGLMHCIGRHGSMYLWDGCGIRVHARTVPDYPVPTLDEAPIFVDAKPASHTDMPVKTAVALLSCLPK